MKQSQVAFRMAVMAAVLLSILVVVSVHTAVAADLKGRDIAHMGRKVKPEGVLKPVGDEWVLVSGGKNYDLHFGPREYLASVGIVLKEGHEAVIRGFLYKDDVAVAHVETGGKAAVLRDESGRPTWSGTKYARGGHRAN